MSTDGSILTILCDNNSVNKAEDPQAYAKLANQGLLLGHPVKIKGKDKRTDNGVNYHTTVKFFNPEKDSQDDVHDAASKLEMHPPHPDNTDIETGTIKDRAGNDVHIIKLKGPHADKIKEHHKKFSHMGHKENYEFEPHISVDKDTHDRIKASGAKTAKEAGIEFGHAELKHGKKVLHSYAPKKEKLAASEKNINNLQKGALKNIAAGAAMVGALASGSTGHAPETKPEPYSRERVSRAIASVESSSGKNTNHKPTSQGTAYGAHALMPNTIHDAIKMDPKLKKQHQKALKLKGNDLNRYMQDNPKLENAIVESHLSRLEHHFGQNPMAISHAWNQGITGTNRALKDKQDIGTHPYVQKFKEAYKKGK